MYKYMYVQVRRSHIYSFLRHIESIFILEWGLRLLILFLSVMFCNQKALRQKMI